MGATPMRLRKVMLRQLKGENRFEVIDEAKQLTLKRSIPEATAESIGCASGGFQAGVFPDAKYLILAQALVALMWIKNNKAFRLKARE